LNFLQIEEGSKLGRDSAMGISEFRRLQLKYISDAYIYWLPSEPFLSGENPSGQNLGGSGKN
jgi:hypothetical protein